MNACHRPGFMVLTLTYELGELPKLLYEETELEKVFAQGDW